MAPAKHEPSHVVIDKNTTARVNIGILITLVVTCVGAAGFLQSIQHAVSNVDKTLLEVKAQLDKQNGTAQQHTGLLIRQGERLNHLETRVQSLEKTK